MLLSSFLQQTFSSFARRITWIPLFFPIFDALAIQSIEADSKVKRTKVKSDSGTFYNSSLIYWLTTERGPFFPLPKCSKLPLHPTLYLSGGRDCVMSKWVPLLRDLSEQVLLQRGTGSPTVGVQRSADAWARILIFLVGSSDNHEDDMPTHGTEKLNGPLRIKPKTWAPRAELTNIHCHGYYLSSS